MRTTSNMCVFGGVQWFSIQIQPQNDMRIRHQIDEKKNRKPQTAEQSNIIFNEQPVKLSKMVFMCDAIIREKRDFILHINLFHSRLCSATMLLFCFWWWWQWRWRWWWWWHNKIKAYTYSKALQNMGLLILVLRIIYHICLCSCASVWLSLPFSIHFKWNTFDEGKCFVSAAVYI